MDIGRSLCKLTLGSTLLLGGLAFPPILAGEGIAWGALLATALASAAAGNTANAIDALVDWKNGDRVSLENENLTEAVGKAIAAVITLAAKNEKYDKKTRQHLEKIAAKAKDNWVELARFELSEDPYIKALSKHNYRDLMEEQLPKAVTPTETGLTAETILTPDEWRNIFLKLDLMADADERFEFSSEVKQEVAELLYTTFPKALRETLKEDFADDGKAFAGFTIQLLAGIKAEVELLRNSNLGTNAEDLPQILDCFQQLETQLRGTAAEQQAVFSTISQQIDSGFANVTELLNNLGEAVERLRREVAEMKRQQGGKQPSTATVLPTWGAVDTVPKLPPHFLPREEDLQELKGRLLARGTQTVVMTGQPRQVGLQGMGGIGKTVLAAAVARDAEVRQRFRHGVVWLTVGIQPKPIELYQRVATTLGETYAYQEGDAQWNAYLSNLLREKSCLLVLDDVWQQREAERFVEILGEDCRLLLTTRDAGLIAGLGAEGHRVEMLAEGQARLLLANWAGLHLEMLPPEAAQVVKHCGKLPLALALSGAQVAQGTSWADLLAALEAADLKFLDGDDSDRSIYKSLEASVGVLEERKRRAYWELGLVAPDVEVSEAALVKLWGRDGDVPDYGARRWLTEFAQRALVFARGESPERWVSLHDVQQKYLQEKLRDKTALLHREWLRGYGGGKFPWSGADIDKEEVYLYRQGAYHFLAAGEEEAFGQLLGDFDWLQQKLAATDIEGVLADFAVLSSPDPFLSRLERALRLSAHVLKEDKSQLASQLWGRLLEPKKMRRFGYRYFWQKIPKLGRYLPQYPSGGQVELLLLQARARQQGLWFRPLIPCLDSPDGGLIRTFTGHSDWVNAVAIAPDGKRGLSGSYDNTMKLWNLDVGLELHTFIGHSDSILAVAIAPDGKRGLSGSADKTLKLWDLESGRELRTFTGHSSYVNAVAIAPDGKRGLSGSADDTLKLWDLESGRELRSFTGHSSYVMAVAIAPDGKRGLSGSYDNTLKLWDLESGQELRTFTGHSGSVNAVAIAPDGKRGLSGSDDKTLKLWDLESGRELRTFTGHSNDVRAVAIAPDGKRGLSGSWDNTLKLWDLESGRELRSFTGHSYGVNAVAIAPDGKRGLSGSGDKTLKLWDLESVRELRAFTGHSSSVNAVAIAPDGKRGLSGSWDKTLKLWDLESGRELRTFIGHSVRAVAIAPDGKRGLSGSWDNTLKLWNLESGRELRSFTGHSNLVTAVAIAPDGKRGLSGSDDKTLKLWDLESGRELRSFNGHSSFVNAVAIAPDGKRGLSGSVDETLKLWDLESGQELRTFTGHSDDVRAVAIHPDGKRGLSGSVDNTLKLWDLESGRELRSFTGHSDGVYAVAIAPDGKRGLSGSEDKTLKLWDLESGEVLATFTTDYPVISCAIAPDGLAVVAGDRSGRLYFLRLEGGVN